jgi:hypothetical protein
MVIVVLKCSVWDGGVAVFKGLSIDLLCKYYNFERFLPKISSLFRVVPIRIDEIGLVSSN